MGEATDTNETAEVKDQDEPKGLRKQLAEAHGRIKDLQAREMKRSFDELGLDTSKGLGKAIAKEYEGEITAEAIATYAKTEYDWTPEERTPSNPLAGQIAQEQGKLDAVGQTAGSVAPPSEADALAKAEAEGDYQTAMAIKSRQIAAMFQPRR